MARDRHGNVVSRLAEIKLDDLSTWPDWQTVVPISVGIMQVQVGDMGQAASMVVVLDLEGVPGLAEAVARHEAGHQFDTMTAWSSGPLPGFDFPVAVMALELPEIDLGFLVAIDVAQYSLALKMVAQTQYVMIVDPEQYRNLLSTTVTEADGNGRSFLFPVADASPILPLILQHADFPPKPSPLDPLAEGDEPYGSVEELLDGATPVELVTIQVTPGNPPLVILRDPGAGALNHRLGSKPYFDGSWFAMAADDGPLVRLDCALEGERVASWLLRSPSQELVRLTASGPHGVMVVDRDRGDDEAAVRSYLRLGVPVFTTAATQQMLKIMEKPVWPDEEAGSSVEVGDDP